MRKPKNKLLLLSLGIFCLPFFLAAMTTGGAKISGFDTPRGTLKNPIIDSRVTEKEAFDDLDPNCPPEIRRRQRIVKVKYYSNDQKIHQGQIIVDKDLVGDVKLFFQRNLKGKIFDSFGDSCFRSAIPQK